MADLNKKDFSVDIQSRLPKVKKIIGCIVKKREAWRAAVHGVAKSQTQLSDLTTTSIRELCSGIIKIVEIA